MRAKLWVGLAAAAAVVVLPACGKRFPGGEKLSPQTYGPPFGVAVVPNLPKHPHIPGDEERLAATDDSESKIYRDHKACQTALLAAVKKHGGGEDDVKTISAIETIAHVDKGKAEPVHEYRCSDYVLSYRSWCRPAGHGGDEGVDHGKPAGGHGEAHRKKPQGACGSEGVDH